MLRQKFSKLLSAAVVFSVAASSSANALYISPATNEIYASKDSFVTIRFESSSAANSTDVISEKSGAVALNNKTAAPAQEFVIGAFSADEAITFKFNNLTSGKTYFSGGASRNFDDEVHLELTQNIDGTVTAGFEDLENGGDKDFNDVIFSVIETAIVETPLPAAAWLLMSGAFGLFFASRQRSKA